MRARWPCWCHWVFCQPGRDLCWDAIWYGMLSLVKQNDVAALLGVHPPKRRTRQRHAARRLITLIAHGETMRRPRRPKRTMITARIRKPHTHSRQAIGEGAIYTGSGQPRPARRALCSRRGSKLSPFIAMVLGFLMAMWFYIWDPKMPKRRMETNASAL